MKIAIMGGTYNPPHSGHMFFANEVRQQLGYDKIIFVPTATPAHKEKDHTIKDSNRVDMLKLAVENYDWAEVSLCDIRRGGVTRTIDTLMDIKTEYKLVEKPGFIIGDDLADGFKDWKNPEMIIENANLIIGVRENRIFDIPYPYKKVNNKVFPLSSSEIRDRVYKNLDIDFLLPEKVVEYIRKNELYQKEKEDR